MKLKEIFHGKALARAARIVLWIYLATVAAAILHYGRRIFVAERFTIPSWSMSPTLMPGDRVWVNKLLFGARIYTGFDFSEQACLKCFRMPGCRKIHPGDIIVFNFPFGGNDWNRIEFRINYVYCKRVLGTPGDTISVCNGINRNSRFRGSIGVVSNQSILAAAPDSMLAATGRLTSIPLSFPVWTIKDMGPLYVPQKGATIQLDSLSWHLYRHIIEYETGHAMNGMKEYTFRKNWYFAVGDNCMDSKDSRYWGFIPEEFIIGIISHRTHEWP